MENVTASARRLREYLDAGSLVHGASSYMTADGKVHLIHFSDLRCVLDAIQGPEANR